MNIVKFNTLPLNVMGEVTICRCGAVSPGLKDSLFIATYNVTSTTSTTTLLGSDFDISQIEKMYIDDVEVTPTGTYTFSSTGEHVVKGIMNESVTNMEGMFAGCTSLTSLDLSNFDTSNVTNMGYMFYECTSLTSLDLSNFDTSNVTNMGYMFYGCTSLTSLDPFYNWKKPRIDLSYSLISAQNVHDLIYRSMDTADGATARALTLHTTTKTNWEASEYYEQDLELLTAKGITIA